LAQKLRTLAGAQARAPGDTCRAARHHPARSRFLAEAGTAPIVQGLGWRHAGYGVVDADYQTVGGALLKTLQGLGSDFTPAVDAAWTEVYGILAGTMIAAAKA
jgi:hemoglobin-like flavoprotein